jgi:hypothetical protein
MFNSLNDTLQAVFQVVVLVEMDANCYPVSVANLRWDMSISFMKFGLIFEILTLELIKFSMLFFNIFFILWRQGSPP